MLIDTVTLTQLPQVLRQMQPVLGCADIEMSDAVTVGGALVEFMDMANFVNDSRTDNPGLALSHAVYGLGTPQLSDAVFLGSRTLTPVYYGSSGASPTPNNETREALARAGSLTLRLKSMSRLVPGVNSSTRAVDGGTSAIYPSFSGDEDSYSDVAYPGENCIVAHGSGLESIPLNFLTDNVNAALISYDKETGENLLFARGPSSPHVERIVSLNVATNSTSFKHVHAKLDAPVRSINDKKEYIECVLQQLNGSKSVVIETCSRSNKPGDRRVDGRATCTVIHTFNGVMYNDKVVFAYTSTIPQGLDASKIESMNVTFLVTIIPMNSPLQARFIRRAQHRPLTEGQYANQYTVYTTGPMSYSDALTEPRVDGAEITMIENHLTFINESASQSDPYTLLPYALHYPSEFSDQGFRIVQPLDEGGKLTSLLGKFSSAGSSRGERLERYNCMHYGGIEIEDVKANPQMVGQLFEILSEYISEVSQLSVDVVKSSLRILLSCSSLTESYNGSVSSYVDGMAPALLGDVATDITFTVEEYCSRVLLSRFYNTNVDHVISRMLSKSDMHAAYVPRSVYQNGVIISDTRFPSGFVVQIASSAMLPLLNKFKTQQNRLEISGSHITSDNDGEYIGVVHEGFREVNSASKFVVVIGGQPVSLDGIATGMHKVVTKYMINRTESARFVIYHPEFAFIYFVNKTLGQVTMKNIYFIDHPRLSSIIPSPGNLDRLVSRATNRHMGTSGNLGLRIGLLQKKFNAGNRIEFNTAPVKLEARGFKFGKFGKNLGMSLLTGGTSSRTAEVLADGMLTAVGSDSRADDSIGKFRGDLITALPPGPVKSAAEVDYDLTGGHFKDDSYHL